MRLHESGALVITAAEEQQLVDEGMERLRCASGYLAASQQISDQQLAALNKLLDDKQAHFLAFGWSSLSSAEIRAAVGR